MDKFKVWDLTSRNWIIEVEAENSAEGWGKAFEILYRRWREEPCTAVEQKHVLALCAADAEVRFEEPSDDDDNDYRY